MSENGGSGRNSDDDDESDASRENGHDNSNDNDRSEDTDRPQEDADRSGEHDRSEEPDASEGPDSPEEPDRSSGDETVEKVSLSLDATLELLADSDRRAVLDYLVNVSDGTATTADLAEHVADRRADETAERPDEDEVRTAIHHVHVPKLADEGVVDYDPRSRDVRYWGSELLETWLERVQSDD